MSDSITVRVQLDSYNFANPREKQTQVKVCIPDVGRAFYLLPAGRFAELRDAEWGEVLDAAIAHQEQAEQRGGSSVAESLVAARKALREWLQADENRDALNEAWFQDRARRDPVSRSLLQDKERLTARIAELEAVAYGDATVRLLSPVEQIRHLHACVTAQLSRADTLDRLLREKQARVAELDAALPSRLKATPAEVDAYLRTILAEDTYLRFQQEIGAQALHEVIEDAQKVRASADNDGLYNADWREGWDDAIERVDPELCGPSPSVLVEFVEADGITRRIAPVQALRGDETAPDFFKPGHTYAREHHAATIRFLVRYVDDCPDGFGRVAFGWRVEDGDVTYSPFDSDDFTGWALVSEGGDA
ncbi:hypothetical protein ACFZBC_08790 [Streptomyces luteogriseus]|uniref:hypothetical protein n=1 Tax=Streptomyces luteogriseus TaxID=68233 RepID=UPI0036EBB0AD